VISPELHLERSSRLALRITVLLFRGLVLVGVVCLVAAVYSACNGVPWYKLGGLVGSSASIFLSAHIGLRSVRERRRAAERASEPKSRFLDSTEPR